MVPQDFIWKVEESLLHIKGVKRSPVRRVEGVCKRIERRYGIFERKIPLPPEVTEKGGLCSYTDGVFSIVLRKKKTAIDTEMV